MFTWVAEHEYPITTQGYPIVLSMRLRQVSLAVPTPTMATRIKKDAETGERSEIDYVKLEYDPGCTSSKLDALQEIVSDLPEGERVLVLTHSAGIIPAMLARLAKIKVNAAGWWGGVSSTERQQIKDSFIHNSPNYTDEDGHTGDGSGVQVICAQIGAIGEGVDGLQWACSNEVWFSMDSNGMLNTQAAGRLVRDGQRYAVNSWSLEAADTIEHDQMLSLDRQSKIMHGALNI